MPSVPRARASRDEEELEEELIDDEREEELDEDEREEDDEDVDDEEREEDLDEDDERADASEDDDEEREDDLDEEERADEDDDERADDEDDEREEDDEEPQRAQRPRRLRAPRAVVHREMALRVTPEAVARARAAGEEAPIEIALSSETPVERYDYWYGRYREVLEHSSTAVDFSRAENGLPLLLDHDSREQIGRIEGLRIDADRVLRGTLRFSRSARAQEIRTDILDGIRADVSVGYHVRTLTLAEQDEDAGDTYRATRWTPMEGSIVAVPADPSVGVGRAHPAARRPRPQSPDRRAGGAARQPSPAPRSTDRSTDRRSTSRSPAPQGQETRMPQRSAARPGAAPNATVRDSQAEQSRADTILALATEHGLDLAEARSMVTSGLTVSGVRAKILERYRNGQLSLTPPNPGSALSLTDGEERRYSMLRAINAVISGNRKDAGFEFEVSDEIAKRTGKQTQGVFIPTTLRAALPGGLSAAQALDRVRSIDPALATRTQLSVGNKTNTKGGESVFTEYGGFIDLLRSRMVLLEMGAQMMTGLQGDIGFVEQTAPGTFSWGNETTNAGLSSLSTGLRKMSPKVGQSATTYTRQLLAQSVLDVENLIRMDIAGIHARGIDSAGLNGAGGTAPTGVLQTAGIGSVAGGTNGAQPTYEHAIDLQQEIALDNAWVGSVSYVTTPQIAARFMKTQEFASTNGKAVWTGNIFDGVLAGLPARSSTQVPSTLTKGTAVGTANALILGAWDQILIGEWGAMEVLVDPYTVGPALVKIMSIQMIDVFVRYAAAFAAMQDALK